MSSTLASPVSAPAGTRRFATTVGGYVALTKPRIIELLLVSTVPTMVVANAQPGQREALIDSFREEIQPLYDKHEVQFRGAFVGLIALERLLVTK